VHRGGGRAYIDTVGTPDSELPINEGFLGGGPGLFEIAGREQLIVLLEHGLEATSRVLDIGCGCLRGGRWIIPLLMPGHYCGIEPQRHMVERGLRDFVDIEMATLKKPRFDYNERFDFSVFGNTFTHFMARSIWTHAAKPHIEAMLEGVAKWGEPGSVFLTSYHPVRRGWPDYTGEEWVGRSHERAEPGGVAHSFKWIDRTCRALGLSVKALDRPPLKRGGQEWLVVKKPSAQP
jgi:SAM-dependent methyltransferase